MSSILQYSIKKITSSNNDLEKTITKISNINNSIDVNNICNVPNIETIINNQISNVNSVNIILKNTFEFTNDLNSQIETAQKTLSILEGLITTIKLTTYVLPTSVPPGIGIPSGVILSASDTLQYAKQQIDLQQSILDGINNVLNSQSMFIKSNIDKLNNLINVLTLIFERLKMCNNVNTPLDSSGLNQIKDNISNIVSILPKNNINSLNETYKGYTFEIVSEQHPDPNIVVKKRYAVAKNNEGIICFEGKPSYSTLNDILINELKFKIDKESI